MSSANTKQNSKIIWFMFYYFICLLLDKQSNLPKTNITNLKQVLEEKHKDIEKITNLILFYETKVNSLSKEVNTKKEEVQKKLKKLNEEEDIYNEKYRVLRNLKNQEKENPSIEVNIEDLTDKERQQFDIDTILEIKNESDSKINKLNNFEEKLNEKESKLKNQYSLLSEDEKLIFNKYLIEYENNLEIREEVNKYIKSHSIFSKEVNGVVDSSKHK